MIDFNPDNFLLSHRYRYRLKTSLLKNCFQQLVAAATLSGLGN